KTGTVWCWGSRDAGRLAVSPTGHLTPQLVAGAGELAWVAAGPDNVCGIRKDGAMLCLGQDGAVSPVGVSFQTPLTIGSATDWKTVKPSRSSACATKTNDALYCWATGVTPAPVSLTVSTYDIGYSHQCAITSGASGSLYCWGDNIFGKAVPPPGTGTANPTKVG